MNRSLAVIVNGKEHRIDEATSLLDLLRSLDLDPRAVAVELNKQIVRRSSLSTVRLNDGDRIELVHFVGGG